MKRLFGSVIAGLFVLVFAGAAFAQAPREIAPPQEVIGPQETNGLKLEATEEIWSSCGKSLELVVPDSVKREIELLSPSPQPFPNIQSGAGTVLYAREGVRLFNPFNVSFLSISLPYLPDNLEKAIREDFSRRGIPIPFPLIGGKKYLLLRIETTHAVEGEEFRMIVYFTPLTNVLSEK